LKNKGILYIATGENCLEEAIISVKSLKTHNDIHTTIITNINFHNTLFDDIIIIDKPHFNFRDKVKHINKLPYESTIFIDSDTFISANIEELFTLTDRFDIAVAHAPGRKATGTYYGIKNVPDSFTEFNTGIIVFNKNSKVEEFLGLWQKLYNKDVEYFREEIIKNKHDDFNMHDQPSFREAIYLSDIKIATLSTEYNCRFVFPCYISGFVKIFHGRSDDFESLNSTINSSTTKRIYSPNAGLILS